MVNDEQLTQLRKGPMVWNEWRRAHPTNFILLGDAQLSGANLIGADLTRVHLSGANLIGANLIGAILTGAELNRADLTRANLSGANMSRAELIGTNLTDADLTDADLNRANLTGANLTRALLSETRFANMDLSKTDGLNECRHLRPSSIDVRTLIQSRDLPLLFLRGCGLPDLLIDYFPSLTQVSPIQFYSVFISYSTANQMFADRLQADLQAKGVRCWFAAHHMKSGEKVYEQIDDAIRVYDRLLLILSNESMTSSWVKTEIAKARKKEREQRRRVLFPVRLVSFDVIKKWELFDADLGDDSAKEIREYYLPDFSGWKDHDTYSREFQKLLESLKSDPKPAHLDGPPAP